MRADKNIWCMDHKPFSLVEKIFSLLQLLHFWAVDFEVSSHQYWKNIVIKYFWYFKVLNRVWSPFKCHGILSLCFMFMCLQLRHCFSTWHFLPLKSSGLGNRPSSIWSNPVIVVNRKDSNAQVELVERQNEPEEFPDKQKDIFKR